MLALKKKREDEAKAIKDSNATQDVQKISLFGVGGKNKTKSTDSSATAKKRTPGEIRIQKGACVVAH